MTSFKLLSKALKFSSNSRHVETLASGAMVDSLSLLFLPDIVVVGEPSRALAMLSTAEEAEEAASLFLFSSTISLLASSIFFFDDVI